MYYKEKKPQSNDPQVLEEIEKIYNETPVYGYRRITVELRKRGFFVNHKKVQRLMQSIGRVAIFPAKKTTTRNQEHKVYKYLLRDIRIERPNQAWQVDITYIRIKKGFVYLTCLIDIFSRKIMGWALSTFLDTSACLEALANALKLSTPEIINSDQGCQFTSDMWISSLKENGITISMDGKGRWVDNVLIERLWRTIKQELVAIFRFETVDDVRVGLQEFIQFYNQKRFHQSLNYHTPEMIYDLAYIPTKAQLFQFFRDENLRVEMRCL